MSSALGMSYAIADPESFRRACSKYATGITVTTVVAPDGSPHGLTVNSFTSVSLNPPLVLVCVDYRATVLEYFRSAQYYAVNILSEDQRDLSARFAQKGRDRFESLDWTPGKNGAPRLTGVVAFFECRVVQTVEAGDHAIFIGEVVDAGCTETRPLLYFNRDYQRLG